MAERDGNRRFAGLLEAVIRPCPADVKGTVMTLINAMINAVAELEGRTNLRREFLDQNIVEEIKVFD